MPLRLHVHARFLAGLLVAAPLVGCGSAGLPPPGDYKPDPTPEPKTACPKEHQAAKAAREALIGETSTKLREQAAQAAFAHAECERRELDGMAIDAVDEASFQAGIAALKNQAYAAQNLYLEAVNYDIPLYAVGGNARTGELYGAYAKKLRTAEPGAGISDPATRALWFQEMDALATRVEAEGANYFAKALDVIELGPDAFAREEQVAGWARVSCRGLAIVDPGTAAAHRVCTR